MRGQPKRLSRNYLRRNGGNVILYVLVSFHTREVFCTLSRLFFWPGFRLFCARLAVYYFAVYWVLGSIIEHTCFALVCLNISLPFIQLLFFVQGTSVSYFKLLFKFRNVLKHTESRSSFACNQNSKEDIFTALEVFLFFQTKRNET